MTSTIVSHCGASEDRHAGHISDPHATSEIHIKAVGRIGAALRARAEEEIEEHRGSSGTARTAKDQAVLQSCWPWKHGIGSLEDAASAFLRGMWMKGKVANDQAGLAKACATNADMGGSARAAIAGSRGWLTKPQVANDHAVFGRSC